MSRLVNLETDRITRPESNKNDHTAPETKRCTCSPALIELASPDISKSRSTKSNGSSANASINFDDKSSWFLLEAGCSTLPKTAKKVRLLCLCIALVRRWPRFVVLCRWRLRSSARKASSATGQTSCTSAALPEEATRAGCAALPPDCCCRLLAALISVSRHVQTK